MLRLVSLCLVASAVVVTTAETFIPEQPEQVSEVVRDSHVEPTIRQSRPVTVVTDDGSLFQMQALEPMLIAHQRDLYGPCGEWRDEALLVGWTDKEWEKLRWIIARETGSTCDPTVHNGNEQTRDDSFGLLQINMRGRLEADRLARCGLGSKQELWDPVVNLRCGRVLFELAGWDPWRKR